VLLASKYCPASKLADNKAVASLPLSKAKGYRTPRPALAGGALRSRTLVTGALVTQALSTCGGSTRRGSEGPRHNQQKEAT
jgi:hypothetical protein